MKSNLFSKAMLSLLCIVFCMSATAQKMIKQTCYSSYKNQGDAYSNLKKYDLAIQQYKSAKYCNSLSTIQRRTLDSLIADVGRKRQTTPKKILIRKY